MRWSILLLTFAHSVACLLPGMFVHSVIQTHLWCFPNIPTATRTFNASYTLLLMFLISFILWLLLSKKVPWLQLVNLILWVLKNIVGNLLVSKPFVLRNDIFHSETDICEAFLLFFVLSYFLISFTAINLWVFVSVSLNRRLICFLLLILWGLYIKFL